MEVRVVDAMEVRVVDDNPRKGKAENPTAELIGFDAGLFAIG